MSRQKAVAWIQSENVAEGRLRARGRLEDRFINGSIVLAGCGALGSHFAEYFVRSGVQEITLVDGDTLEPGNLARHVCTFRDIKTKESKARALRHRLSVTSPHATINALSRYLPVSGQKHEEIVGKIGSADIVFDLTTSRKALRYLDDVCGECDTLLVAAYISFGATSFCVFSNSSQRTAQETEQKLLEPIKRDGIYDEMFPPAPRERRITEGTGCWSSTFPAKEYQIAEWVAFAIGQIESYVDENCSSPFGLVARKEASTDAGLVEIVHRLPE